MSSHSRAWLWLTLVVAGAAVVWWAAGAKRSGRTTRSAPARAIAKASPLEGNPLPSLGGATAWIGGPITPDSLAGRVAVVGMMSLNLPTSLEAARALQSWHDAYSRYGLRVLAVQIPEFAFAAESGALSAVARRAGLSVPLALDASLEVWRTFGAGGDRPRFVVVDPSNRVVMDREGVAAIAEIEDQVRVLLQRERPDLRFPASAPVHVRHEASHVPVHLGQAHAVRGPLEGAVPGRAVSFTAQMRYQVEGEAYTPYPIGRWIPGADGVTAARGGAENFVALRYDAGALGAVLGPAEASAARFWILRDDHWLSAEEAGTGVRFDGRGASFVDVEEPGLYVLIRPSRGVHVVKLSPDSPGAIIYAFTFDAFVPAPVAGR